MKKDREEEFEIEENECYSTVQGRTVSYREWKEKKGNSYLRYKCGIPLAVLVAITVILAGVVLFQIFYLELYKDRVSVDCFSGLSPSFPASSCTVLHRYPSGYYWILSSNGSVIRAFCDMTRTCGNITGGWMRVAQLDMRDTSSQCPSSLCPNHTLPRTCRICGYNGTCSSDIFSVYTNYSKVCGKIIGYQIGSVDAFSMVFARGFDGVKLSYGNPSKNIWTFAAAFAENYDDANSLCQCINQSDTTIPAAPTNIGSNYFCDSGTQANVIEDHPRVYSSNPLWDGAGCGSASTCCSFNSPPWFYRGLPQPITEDIEMRVCRDENRNNEDIAIELVDVYVQ